jgi:hypothetical protein
MSESDAMKNTAPKAASGSPVASADATMTAMTPI